MEHYDVIIVGAGPAGSTCAAILTRAGFHTLILERGILSRTKLCAGWITPDVFELLEITPKLYRGDGTVQQRVLAPIRRFVVWDSDNLGQLCDYHKPVSYGILRAEFDGFLASRCGARIIWEHKVSSIKRQSENWVVDNKFCAPMLIGAGGHFCPVARTFKASSPQEKAVGCMEAEFDLSEYPDIFEIPYPNTPELLFCDDLNGYGWFFHKEKVVNIGIGRYSGKNVRHHLQKFLNRLGSQGRIRQPELIKKSVFKGHAYKLHRLHPRRRVYDGAMLIGDSAGVAYNISGEGIRPAIISAKLAAQTLISAQGVYDQERLKSYLRGLDNALGAPYTGIKKALWDRIPASAARTLAGRMLGSKKFVKEVVVDRLFLRASGQWM